MKLAEFYNFDIRNHRKFLQQIFQIQPIFSQKHNELTARHLAYFLDLISSNVEVIMSPGSAYGFFTYHQRTLQAKLTQRSTFT